MFFVHTTFFTLRKALISPIIQRMIIDKQPDQTLSKETLSDEPKKKPISKDGGFWEIIRFTLIALAIVIPVRMFIAQPFVVSGESMFPTFENGDYLIIDEISYHLGQPHRGDVVVFRYPLKPDRFFIKRIIALPNETIKFDDGIITITTAGGETISMEEPYIQEQSAGNFTTKLADDEYFVMGDNRNASSDSRVWGPLQKDFITGRALVRLLPASHVGILPGDYKQETN